MITPTPSDVPALDYKQKIQLFFAKLQMGDLCFLDVIKYGFALFGMTKAGKTTLAHYLIHNPLQGQVKQIGVCYKLREGAIKFKQAIIGQTNQSETQIPNQCKTVVKNADNSNLDVTVLDCPGYEDSNGCLMLIANGYFHYRIFSKVQNLKFILTFDYKNLEGICEQPKKTLIQFLSSFKNINQIKDKIFKATVFVFTKVKQAIECSKQQMMANVQKKLQGFRNCGNIRTVKAYTALMIELIDQVIQQQKFFVFEMAEESKMANDSNLLQKIHQKTNFWSREIIVSGNERQVSMKDIMLTLGDNVMDRCNRKVQNFEQDFTSLTSVFSNRFRQTFLDGENTTCSLQHIFTLFLKNSLIDGPESSQFFQLVKQFNQRFNIYQNSNLNQRPQYAIKRKQIKQQLLKFENKAIDNSGIIWIQKLQMSRLIIDMLQIKESLLDVNKRSLLTFKSITDLLINVISQFKKLRFQNVVPRYKEEMVEFSYIVYRIIEQAKTFKIIFNADSSDNVDLNSQVNLVDKNVDTSLNLIDFLTSLLAENYYLVKLNDHEISFSDIKVNYLTNVIKEIKKNAPLEYYLQIQDYFGQIDKLTKKQFNDKITEVVTLKLKHNSSKILKNQKIHTMIERIAIFKKNIIDEVGIDAIQSYIQYMNQAGIELSKKDNKYKEGDEPVKKALRYSITIFKCTQNVHRTINSYKLLVQQYLEDKQPQNLKNVLLQFGEYASCNGRGELAMELYQRAYSVLDIAYEGMNNYFIRNQERERIGRLIGMLGLQKVYDNSQKYYEQMMSKDFYTLIDDNILEEMKMNYPKKSK